MWMMTLLAMMVMPARSNLYVDLDVALAPIHSLAPVMYAIAENVWITTAHQAVELPLLKAPAVPLPAATISSAPKELAKPSSIPTAMQEIPILVLEDLARMMVLALKRISMDLAMMEILARIMYVAKVPASY